MQAIIELSITEYSLTMAQAVNPDFNKDEEVREQYLLIHANSLLKIY